MSSPATRGFDPPTECEMDNDVPPVAGMQIKGHGNNGSQDNSMHFNWNSWGPWVTLCGILSGVSIGIAIGMVIAVYYMTARQSVSENHWRNIEVDVGVMKSDIQQLKEKDHAQR